MLLSRLSGSMLRRAALVALVALSFPACSCDPAPPPGDGGPPDAPLPPGDRGLVLGVPETAALDVAGLEGEVYVLYTEAGVPHVYASNEHDLRLVQGFLFARDRYFQLELMRRYARGELSDLIGTPALTIDIRNRGLGKRAVATRLWSMLSPEEQATWDAHAEGVNGYIAAVAAGDASPPSELAALRGVLGARRVTDLMEPVTGEGLVSILGEIIFQFGFEDEDLTLSQAVATAADALASDPRAALLVPGLLDDVIDRYDPVTPVTSVECTSPPCFALDGGGSSPFFPPLSSRSGAAPRTLERGLRDRIRALGEFLDAPHGGHGADFGSNAWAVGAPGTPGGGAVLAGDGHLPLHVPTLLTQIGLDTSVFGDGTDATATQFGCFLPGVPFMALGTNGDLAWSFTYQNADATDWYTEELVLSASGEPMATVFGAETRPVVAIDETYHVAAVDFFMSVERDETWTRWTTFDGRPIVLVEGHTPADGEPGVIRPDGTPVVAGDEDGDGVVTAISVDYVGYDLSNIIRMLAGFGAAGTVEEFRTAIRRNVAFTSNFVAADQSGSVLYTSYSATPCRLDRRTAGAGSPWAPGADPQALVDGTTYAGFEIPLGADGLPDESMATDPNRCVVPGDAWPEALDPTRGFVLTANNDIAGTTLDGDVENDPYYIGSRYDVGYRADTIRDELERLTAMDGATAETMAALQASHTSVTARDYLPDLQAAIATAVAAVTIPAASRTPDEARLAALYEPGSARIEEAMTRLSDWADRGFHTASGVPTFYDTIEGTEDADAVATMIWAETFRRLMARILDDEGISEVFAVEPRRLRGNLFRRLFRGRGPGNPEMLASWDPATEEPAYFDDRTTPGATERSEEALVGAVVDALAALEAAPSAPATGGFGTTDMGEWLWGMRHQVRFESIVIVYAGDTIPMADALLGSFAIATSRLPLAEPLPDTDPRAELDWFPRPGDFFDVDASTPSFEADADYTYAYGPVMRLAIELEGGRVSGRNVIPGGQSGVTSDDHFSDQAALWLGNETVPLRFHVDDVVAGATSRETFRPAP